MAGKTNETAAETKARKAGAFDIRNFIGLLIGIYGVVLLITSFFDDAAEIELEAIARWTSTKFVVQ